MGYDDNRQGYLDVKPRPQCDEVTKIQVLVIANDLNAWTA
jgi:hypothetical protein